MPIKEKQKQPNEKPQESSIQWKVLTDPLLEKIKEHIKNPGGRPVELTEKVIKDAQEYLQTQTDTLYDYRLQGTGVTMIKKAQLPTRGALALYLGKDDETIGLWCVPNEKDSDELRDLRQRFSAIVKCIDTMQREMLVRGSLDGTFTAASANFQLAAKHGYITKTAIEQRNTDSIDTPDFWKEVSNSTNKEDQ